MASYEWPARTLADRTPPLFPSRYPPHSHDFVTRFNAAYGVPGREQWDITNAEWQRYEFLGDRVLNLIVAQTLFTQRDSALSEGEMTRILSSVMSNRALDGLIHQYGDAFARLIPASIAEQNTYGERVTGGRSRRLSVHCTARPGLMKSPSLSTRSWGILSVPPPRTGTRSATCRSISRKRAVLFRNTGKWQGKARP